MKRILLTFVAIAGLLAMSFSPAHAAGKRVGNVEGPVAGVDCPTYEVGASIQKSNIPAAPLNLAFGASIGHDKADPVIKSCDSEHRLDVKYYLFLLPLLGPRTLVSVSGTDAFCDECTRVQGYSSTVALPGIYQVVADYYVDLVQVNSVETPTFLYIPLLTALALTVPGDLPTIPTLP